MNRLPSAALSILLLFFPHVAIASDAIALVNGKPVSREAVVNLLIESHGLAALQQMVLLELARQETQAAGIAVSRADVQREYEQSVERLLTAEAPGERIEAVDKRRVLDLLLEQKGISHAEFMISMERNAHLRKLVEKNVVLSEATLREEFSRTYGERVEVRDIIVADSAALSAALEALNRGEDFARVAERFSRHPSATQGGLLPPFSFADDQIPPLVREAAFALAPGEVSAPLRVEERFHVLRLERRLPPEHVRFEDVRAEVERSLRERVVTTEMSRRAAALFEKATVKVLEQRLREPFDALRQRAAAPSRP
ncbi:MAG: peptidyl-prolyl cis-trans isomerase [Phycisphaerales bacterium]|nr:peptidyl-prolyl cis-trans isomerase [Phycisphaerales bacterium]